MRAGAVRITTLSSKAQILLQAAGSEPSRFVPVPLSRFETHLLDSLANIVENRRFLMHLACRRNPGVKFPVTQLISSVPGSRSASRLPVSVSSRPWARRSMCTMSTLWFTAGVGVTCPGACGLPLVWRARKPLL